MSRENMETLISEMLEGFLSDNGLELYRVMYKKEGKDWVLRVFLDKPEESENEYVDVEECELVTRFLSDKLDELDVIERSYNLEVSSPGLDRELIKDSDFTRFAGRLVEIKTYEPYNGVKDFEAVLLGKKDGIVTVDLNGTEAEIPENKISKINLAVVF